MPYRATNPDRIREKLRECAFFLDQMTDYEKSKAISCFMFCLSAFLSSFRTALYRLNGVVYTRRGTAAAKNLWLQLQQSEKDLWFVKQATDMEVHGDGATIWPDYKVSVLSPMDELRYRGRFSSRFESRFHRFDSHGINVHTTMYRFEGHPGNLIEFCRESLVKLETVVQKELAALAGKP